MSENTTLDLSNVINVSIQSAPTNLNTPNVNTLALFSTETPITGWAQDQEYKIYTSASDVMDDFGSTSWAYKMAAAAFSQNPNFLATNGYFAVVLREVAESTQTAIARVKDKVFFAGILIDEEMHSSEAAFIALTTYVQTLDKLFFYASSDVTDYAASAMLDDVRTASKTKTRCLYHSDTPRQFAAAYAARALSVDFSGSNTASTVHLKSLSTIDPDTTVDATALAAVQAAGVDVYISLRGVSGIFSSGENGFFDEIYNELWFKLALETAGFNVLRQTNSKIPQTEIGIESLKNAYRRVCEQAVNNGYIGPGTWTSPDSFGSKESLVRNILTVGYYIYSSPLSQQSQTDREDRKAPLIQIAVKAQGAVHKSNVQVNVNL